MEYQFDSDKGVHSFYKEIDEDGDYSFFCKVNLELKNKVEVVYFEGQDSNNKTKSVFLDYSDVHGLINSEYVIQIIAIEESYSITISAVEVWVRAQVGRLQKEKATRFEWLYYFDYKHLTLS